MVNNGTLDQQKHTTLSYDEKPGIQAIKNIAAQLLPTVDKHACIGRDYEYKRLGTVSLLAGIHRIGRFGSFWTTTLRISQKKHKSTFSQCRTDLSLCSLQSTAHG